MDESIHNEVTVGETAPRGVERESRGSGGTENSRLLFTVDFELECSLIVSILCAMTKQRIAQCEQSIHS